MGYEADVILVSVTGNFSTDSLQRMSRNQNYNLPQNSQNPNLENKMVVDGIFHFQLMFKKINGCHAEGHTEAAISVFKFNYQSLESTACLGF